MTPVRQISLIRSKTDPEVWRRAWSIAMPHIPIDDGRPILTFQEGSQACFRISLLLDRFRRGLSLLPPTTRKPPQ